MHLNQWGYIPVGKEGLNSPECLANDGMMNLVVDDWRRDG
jgi:hypothetical protein